MATALSNPPKSATPALPWGPQTFPCCSYQGVISQYAGGRRRQGSV